MIEHRLIEHRGWDPSAYEAAPEVAPEVDVTMRRRILVVDDDLAVREMVSQYLELEDYLVLQAANGVEALRLAKASPPDLVILDLSLPGIDGLEVCRRLRAVSAVPILMLTARTAEADKLSGFDMGTDDYLTKPFAPQELLMRIKAIMRRLEATSVPAMVLDDALRVGDLVIRPALREVNRAGAAVELTAREFDLLYFLASHPKQIFSRQQLLHHVWNYDFGDQDTVTVHMSRLREKVEADPAKPSHLRTVWRVGYKFEP
jgi:DNA-binding response OmpR family regulator